MEMQEVLSSIKKDNVPLKIDFTCLKCREKFDALNFIVQDTDTETFRLVSLCPNCRSNKYYGGA